MRVSLTDRSTWKEETRTSGWSKPTSCARLSTGASDLCSACACGGSTRVKMLGRVSLFNCCWSLTSLFPALRDIQVFLHRQVRRDSGVWCKVFPSLVASVSDDAALISAVNFVCCHAAGKWTMILMPIHVRAGEVTQLLDGKSQLTSSCICAVW